MKLIKKLFLILLIVVGLSSGVYWANAQGYFNNTPLANISIPEIKLPSQISDKIKLPEKISTDGINKEKIDEIAQDASTQTKELATKAQEVGEHAQKILGTTVQEGEVQPPIHERALEYGQYIYCKEVVREYEKSVIW